MRKKLLAFIVLMCPATFLSAQTGVLTQHNDLYRTGWNSQETILNTKNVKQGSFGKLFSRSVDDQIYAQPLVMLNLAIPGQGNKNVVFVATVNNSVYAFDADSVNVTQPYWQVNLTPSGSRPILNTDMTGACGGGYRDFSGHMGIVGTPVIDQVSQTLYVVARSVTTGSASFQQYLHALDLSTGAEKPNSPQLISAQATGNGDGNTGGILKFDAQKQNQRCGLLLLNNIVYVTYASHCDWGPYHGWILGYDKSTLAQKIVYNSTPQGYNGGIWMSGAAPAADESGNLYVAVGNGSIGSSGNLSDVVNRSESAVKLIPAGNSLTVSSFFTPMNYQALEASDLDFGVTQILLIPGTNRAITGCKDGKLYLLDRDQMGGFSTSTNNVIQTIDLGNNAHLRSSLAYYKGSQNQYVYSWSENALLKAFPFNPATNQFDLASTVSSGVQGPTGNNGALLSISSNGSTDSTAVLWTSYAANGDANQSVRPGILRAFSAVDVTKELWNSSQALSDVPGSYAKFNCPTIINGKVYLATFSNALVVYGLKNDASSLCSTPNIGLGKTSKSSSVENTGTPASAAFDGDLTTRWSSQYSDAQSIYADLGGRFDICQIILHWENAFGKDYQIQFSDDAINWTTVLTVNDNALLDNYLSLNGTGRYIKMNGLTRGTQYGYSLWEFEIYGKPSASSCADPSALVATDIYENSVTLGWNGNGASSFNVQYKTVSAVDWTSAVTPVASFTLTGVSCATDYLFRVQGVCDSTHSSNYSNSSSFSALACNVMCNPLPTRWTTQDIGEVGIAGSACYTNGVFDLHGSGDDVWNNQDAFRFSYQTLVGDGEIRVRILTVDQSDAWNKTGIMFRETLASGSRNVFAAATNGNGFAFQSRIVTDDISTQESNLPALTLPYWIKLVKSGSVYSAYVSADGFAWSAAGNSVDAGFGTGVPVYAGLAICSHDNAVISNSTVDNYLFSGVLDIDLQNFTANLTLSKTVQLSWVTTLEMNIRDFIVERSADNLSYFPIDTVTAISSGKFTHQYGYEDASPLLGMAYYRLRITDNSDVRSYSAPVTVNAITSVNDVTNELPPSLFPNPATNGSVRVLQGESPLRSVRLLDVSGRQVLLLKLNDDHIDIPLSPFANGVYIIEIKTLHAVYRDRLIIRN